MGGGPARHCRASHLRLLAGQLVEGVADRVGGLVAAGSDTLADRTALQLDEPRVDTAPGGVDPDGVPALAAHPEPVPRVVLALVAHRGHCADRRFRRRTAVQRGSTAAAACDWPFRGRSSPCRSMVRHGCPTRCDHGSCQRRWGLLPTCPGAAFAAPGPGARAVDRPFQRLRAGPGMMACWGQAQSDAAPRGPGLSSRGRGVCSSPIEAPTGWPRTWSVGLVDPDRRRAGAASHTL
jgi:hypothetical protein